MSRVAAHCQDFSKLHAGFAPTLFQAGSGMPAFTEEANCLSLTSVDRHRFLGPRGDPMRKRYLVLRVGFGIADASVREALFALAG